MSRSRSRRRLFTAAIGAAAGGLMAAMLAVTPPASAVTPDYDPSAAWDASTAPYLGWSSWSMQATKAAGANPQGSYSWLTEQNLLAQADYMAAHLKQYGYDYINIDAGWWRTWNWTPVYDQHGRPAVETNRLPSGMQYIVDHIHNLGLKVGIYMPAGMEAGNEGDNTQPIDLTQTIEGAPECTLADALYPVDPNTGQPPRTNFWQSSYALDFADTSDNCAQAYINSMVDLFQSWGGVDLLKIDGVAPGSGRSDIAGANARYDNRMDVEAYDKAFQATGHHTEIQVSWSIDQSYISDFQPTADSWRTQSDVECYCTTLTNWNTASGRLPSALDWAEHAGPDTGWTNLDSLLVGPNPLSGLTRVERKSVMGIWSVASAPLYLGDDLRDLDAYGLSLITNRDVLAVDQDPKAATLSSVSQAGGANVVSRQLADGDLVVGMFNLSSSKQQVGTTVAAAAAAAGLSLPKRRAYIVKDLWSGDTFQSTGRLSAQVPAHGSVLYRISRDSGGLSKNASAVIDLKVADASLAPGQKTTVTAKVTNTSGIPITDVSVALQADGWVVKHVSGGAKNTLASGSTKKVTFTAKAPSSTEPISSGELVARTTFKGHGTKRIATAVTTVPVISPVQAPRQTANTTGADAVFGQLGSKLAISSAGANVGPAQGGGGGTTPAGDAYGSIYLPGALAGEGTVSATVTQQTGGSSAKAGVMVRNDIDADGTPVGVALYVSNGKAAMVYSNATGGGTSYTTRVGGGGQGAGTLTYPVQLRLARSDTSYVGSYSTDGGTTWTTVGTVTASGQATTQDAGVFQSAGSGTPALAQFDGFGVS
ncbi:NEW3 domain-containing protein [Nocardioides sp.]|uniref:NEW3 domain-containing protein n=1 Tax=Nocardioides sp. TaxID=35761 RepID=UPI0031FEBACC|nr:Carbohydrate binding family 6 [Nocardioides sp.]